MIVRPRALICLCLALAAAGCAAPPPSALPVVADKSSQDALPPPVPGSKAVAALRPQMLDLELGVEVRRPAAPVAPLEQALFSPTLDADLRSAGLAQLASLHLDRGRPEAAGAAARGAYELALQTYGPDHAATLSALGALGETLSVQGRDGQAESLLVLARRRTHDLLGADHPLAVAAADRLAAHRATVAPGLRLLRNLNRRIGLIG
jgi:hypothetical protein